MKRLAAFAGLIALAVALIVLSGVISVKASSGHLGVTSWILDLAKRRSVITRALPIETPSLEDDDLARLGAAHFDRGCRPCHGAPGTPPPAVPARMTPHPPDLARQVGRWRPRELFYIVAHGIKFTGMPAWPSPPRSDEAWAVVAFLRRLPQLDAPAYRALIDTPEDAVVDAGVATLRQCRACHREGSTLTPRLDGQPAEYLRAALDAYADGRRHSGIMRTVVTGLDAETRAALAEVLSAAPDAERASLALPPAGGVIGRGDAARDIPACVECHGPGPRTRDPRYPALAGQPADYLRLQLTLFAEGRRGGSAYADIMQAIATRLTPAQIDEAARAYSSLPEAR